MNTEMYIQTQFLWVEMIPRPGSGEIRGGKWVKKINKEVGVVLKEAGWGVITHGRDFWNARGNARLFLFESDGVHVNWQHGAVALARSMAYGMENFLQ